MALSIISQFTVLYPYNASNKYRIAYKMARMLREYRGGGKKVKTPYREQGTNYPEPRWAGPTPAYGLYARHILLEDVQNADIGAE